MQDRKTIRHYLRAIGARWPLVLLFVLGVLLLTVASVDRAGGASETGEVLSSDRIEEELASLCADVDGAGRVHVMVTTDRTDGVKGVAVVCEGGGSDRVKNELTLLICAVLDLPASRVYVTSGTP